MLPAVPESVTQFSQREPHLAMALIGLFVVEVVHGAVLVRQQPPTAFDVGDTFLDVGKLLFGVHVIRRR